MGQGVDTNVIDTLLDNIFSNKERPDLIPNAEDSCWMEVSKGNPGNMNQKGAFYLEQLGANNSSVDSQFAASEFEDFPMAGNSRYVRLNVPPLVRRATVQITDHAEIQDKSNLKETPVSNLEFLGNDIQGEMRFTAIKDARQLWGNRSNEIARVSAVNTGTRTITFLATANLFGARFLEEGMRTEFRDPSGVLRQTVGQEPYVRLESVNRSTVTAVYQPSTPIPGTVIANDIVYGKGDYNNGMAGIDYHTALTGAWQGLADRSLHDRTRGIRINAAGQSVHAALLRQAVSAQRNRIDQGTGMRAKSKFYASAQIDAYEATGFAQQGYADGGADLKRGFRKLFFGDIPFEYDRFIPYDSIFLGNLSKIDLFEMQKFGPVKDGGTYLRRLPSADGMGWSPKKQVIFQGIKNLGCQDPAGLGVWITGLSVADVSLGYE
jgi:hypothetical protein